MTVYVMCVCVFLHTHTLILRVQADTHLQIKQVGGKTYFALWENLG